MGLGCFSIIKLISEAGIRSGRPTVLSGQSSGSPGLVSGSQEENALDIYIFSVQRLCSIVF